MTEPFEHLKLVCLNVDGVLLPDTFTPTLRRFFETHQVPYTAELERLVISQPRTVGGAILASVVRRAWTPEQALEAFFSERERYLRDHPLALCDGVEPLLVLLRAKGARMVCYGGLAEEYFDRFFGDYARFFTDPSYVCTDAIRPGIAEIVDDFAVPYGQALFVDDIARFAEFAKQLGVAFIGVASRAEPPFQRAAMEATGVRHIVESLSEIDGSLLDRVDREAGRGVLWAGAG